MLESQGSAAPPVDVRLALVLYGGVSLAVYMAGVMQEVLTCVAATAPDAPAPADALAVIYREAADAAGVARVVVDVLAGASAGGINAVFLAKALARGGSLVPIRDLWQREAEAALLIADRHDRPAFLRRRPLPASLFDGDRITQRLLEALAATDGGLVGGDDLDLFVTLTDLRGIPAPLSFADGVVWERRHRQWLHARHEARPGGRRDFDADHEPLLAFAARATSAIPLVFAPARLEDVAAFAAELDPVRHGRAEGLVDAWSRAFALQGEVHPERPHVDGGVLDNKPLALATEALTRRRGGRPARRKLLVLEPHPLDHASGAGDAASPFGAALAGAALPYQETIREDLESLMVRNRRIDRLRTLTRGVLEDREEAVRAGMLPAWSEALPRALFTRLGVAELTVRMGLGAAYGSYHRLQVAVLSDELAQGFAGGAQGEEGWARVRAEVVVPWRRARYRRDAATAAGGLAPTTAFLAEFDLSFRYRRALFVLASIAELRAAFGPASSDVAEDAMLRYRALERIRAALGVPAEVLERGRGALDRRLARLERSFERLAARLAAAQDVRRTARGAVVAVSGDAFAAWADAERDRVGAVVAASSAVSRAAFAWAGVPPAATASAAVAATRVALTWVADAYADFARVDLVRFPFMVVGGVGEEVAPVEVHRFSPRDATAIVDEGRVGWRKLAGARFANFGAFLDADGRSRDASWGRLDGAERLLSALLPEGEGRVRAIARAHEAILASEGRSRAALRATTPLRLSWRRGIWLAFRALRALGRLWWTARRPHTRHPVSDRLTGSPETVSRDGVGISSTER